MSLVYEVYSCFWKYEKALKKFNVIISVSLLPSKAPIKERDREEKSLCSVSKITWRYPILKCCCQRLGLKTFWFLDKMTRSDQTEVLE